MRKRIIPALLASLMLACCTTGTNDKTLLYEAGVSQQLAQHRKANISGVGYTLNFSIPAEKESPVVGNIDISFTLDKPQEIILDYRDTGLVKEVTANGAATGYRTHDGHIIIPAAATAKGSNTIAISFTAGNQSLNRNEEFLYTLLVPDRARTVFPCFDQPDMKATFRLTLEIPAEWTAVSNSPVCGEENSGGRKSIAFGATEPLSTYLFSFVAGEFKRETYDDGKRRFAAYHRETDPERIAQLPTIFGQVAQSLAWMEEYTGVPYPFAKYDFIILPGFQYGGMEHTGATLYNDTQMFLGKHPTPDEELRRVQLIAHETAHMWFGDYVTMKWFDDVWTKEVFANYFAARITEPMFPGINHRLNWLKSITSAALGEDRTAGGTAIRQPLDNMRNAGLIYNNIVYNKAPVMLEKLIELMGEEAFREGIHDYLVKYAYSNASWDDLIAILDSKSSEDLATFSDVWVNSNGMPHIELVKEKERITARQGDPRDRGLLWPQSFGVTLVGDTMREIEVIMHGKESSVNAAGAGEDTILLPNSDGRGYGYFRYDSTSLAWALGNWHGISDETCRQAQLMNLHEAYQHGDIDAGSWLQSLITGLKNEENALIASTACSYIGRPLTEAKDAAKERELLGMAESHSLTSCRLQLLRTLISTATDSTVCTALYTMWQEATHPLLNENDYMNMSYELALRYPQMHKEITATQRARIKNPDRQRQFDFVSRAVTPDTAAQEALFRSLLIAENRRIEPWALKTMGYLCHTLREEQATRYIRPALDALQEIQRTSDIFFPQNWTRTLLRERHSSEALNEVERFLNDNPGYPALLRSKILQAAWTLQRMNKNQ